ncbi:MAG: hypothetical protein ACKOYK_04740 [Cyanobium sp.]
MFFKKQKFFLDLSGQQDGDQEAKAGKAPEQRITIAPPAPAPENKTPPAAARTEKTAAPAPASAAPASAAPPAAATSAVTSEATAAVSASAARTTAEEIAAQLAAEAASRPAPTLATFAPDCLAPGAATPRRRRRAGANLGAFKEIARGLLKS